MKKKLIKTIIDLESKDLDKRELIFLGNHCNFFDYNKNKLIDNCNNEDKNWKKYDNFIKDYAYVIESLKSCLLNNVGVTHPIQKTVMKDVDSYCGIDVTKEYLTEEQEQQLEEEIEEDNLL